MEVTAKQSKLRGVLMIDWTLTGLISILGVSIFSVIFTKFHRPSAGSIGFVSGVVLGAALIMGGLNLLLKFGEKERSAIKCKVWLVIYFIITALILAATVKDLHDSDYYHEVVHVWIAAGIVYRAISMYCVFGFAKECEQKVVTHRRGLIGVKAYLSKKDSSNSQIMLIG